MAEATDFEKHWRKHLYPALDNAFGVSQEHRLLHGGETVLRAFPSTVDGRAADGRFFNVVDLVNKLEAEARGGRQGRMADYLSRMDFIVLD